MEYKEFHSISLQGEKKQIIINLNEKDIVSHYLKGEGNSLTVRSTSLKMIIQF